MILIIDNYDSFVYNIVQYVGKFYPDIRVYRNDEISIEDVKALSPSAIIISPGPGKPSSAGISVKLIQEFYDKVPILGVCLGHQAIYEAFGGRIKHAKRKQHGKTSLISHTATDILEGIPNPFVATRYHSLVVDPEHKPEVIEFIAWSEDDNEVMALKHKEYPVFGVQFHPESIATEYGIKIIENFLKHIKKGFGIKEGIKKVINRENLSWEEASSVMREIMSGFATPAQIAGFLVALRMKGETVDEISAFASIMREFAEPIDIGNMEVLDTCGTGGDEKGSFNISTISAFVVAGAGIPVVKHGNRAVSSSVGSADLLEALGVKINLPPSSMAEIIKKIGIGFLFAPVYHKAMKYAAGPRRELGIKTVFNLLGPLTNPARPKYQVLGVFAKEWVKPIAEVLLKLGVKRAFVVHSLDGLDEVSISSETITAFVDYKKGIKLYKLKPEDFGIERREPKVMQGGDIEYNKRIMLDILDGKDIPQKYVVLMNSALAIIAYGKTSNLKEAVKIAEESIKSGNAKKKLELLIELSNKYS